MYMCIYIYIIRRDIIRDACPAVSSARSLRGPGFGAGLVAAPKLAGRSQSQACFRGGHSESGEGTVD